MVMSDALILAAAVNRLCDLIERSGISIEKSTGPAQVWIRQSEACNILGVTPPTLRSYAEDPEKGIVFKKLGKSKNSTVFYRRETIERLAK